MNGLRSDFALPDSFVCGTSHIETIDISYLSMRMSVPIVILLNEIYSVIVILLLRNNLSKRNSVSIPES